MEEDKTKIMHSIKYKEAITSYQVAKEDYEYNKALLDKYNEEHMNNSMLVIKLLTLIFLFFTGISVALCYQLYFSKETIVDSNHNTNLTDITIAFALISIIVLGLAFIYLLKTKFLANYRHESLLYEQKHNAINTQNNYLEASTNLIKISDTELFSVQTDVDLLVNRRKELIRQKELIKSECNHIAYDLNQLQARFIDAEHKYNRLHGTMSIGTTSPKPKSKKPSSKDLKELADKLNNMPPY